MQTTWWVPRTPRSPPPRWPAACRARGGALLALLNVSAAGCLPLPEPPPRPLEVEALAQSYERPSGTPSEAEVSLVLEVIDELGIPYQAALLQSLHTAVDAASRALGERVAAPEDYTIEGVVHARTDCAGQPATPVDSRDAGVLDLTLAVEGSRLRRSFVGSGRGCRLIALEPPGTMVVTLEFAAAFSSDIGIGEPVPKSLLVAANAVEGTLERPGLLPVSFTRDELHIRLAPDGSTEVLLDLADLIVGGRGTVVLVQRPDGEHAVRAKNGTWTCRSNGASCVLTAG